MNVAKWLLGTVLPLAELAAFITVAAAIGFGSALLLVLAGSLAGVLVLRHAGGSHIARVRVALGDGGVTAMKADSDGFIILLAGILLLIPRLISDVLGLLLLIAPLRRQFAAFVGTSGAPPHLDDVVDLEPEQWRRMPDPEMPDRRDCRDNDDRR